MHDAERRTGPRHDRGQIIVIMVGGIIAMFAMVGLIVDGGNAFANQRNTQNATDSAAEAGATMLSQNISGTGYSEVKHDADVAAAVGAMITANGLAGYEAYYTDVTGQMLNMGGNPVTVTSSAVAVGSGVIPPCLDTGRCIWAHASGVRVLGNKTVGTFVARVVGMTAIAIQADATAAAGFQSLGCDAGAGCGVLPVTFPVTQVTCDGSGNPLQIPEPYQIGVRYVIPLCKNGPGNVGWLDWTPTAGGTSELEANVTNPTNPAIPLPSWQYITGTGNINSAGVDTALNNLVGSAGLILQFDSTCDVEPAGVNKGDCPDANVGGTGSNQWYHAASLSALRLEAVYVNGSNAAECDTGNGATSCIIGTFENFVTSGTVSAAGGSPTSSVGVQLIR